MKSDSGRFRAYLFLIAVVAWELGSFQPGPVQGQVSLNAYHVAITYEMASMLRGLSEEFDSGTSQSREGLQSVMHYQIEIGDLDGAIITLKRGVPESVQRNQDWRAFDSFDDGYENPLHVLEFLERPELDRFVNIESFRQAFREAAISALVQLERPPFPRALARLEANGSGDSSSKGEREPWQLTRRRNAWKVYTTARAKSGDFDWSIDIVRNAKGKLNRDVLSDAVIEGAATRTDAVEFLARLDIAWNDEELSEKIRQRQFRVMVDADRLQEAVDFLREYDGDDVQFAVDSGSLLSELLLNRNEFALCEIAASITLQRIEQLESGENDELYDLSTQFKKATQLMLAGRRDDSLATARPALQVLESAETSNPDEQEHAVLKSAGTDYLMQFCQYLIKTGDIEGVAELFEMTQDPDVRIQLAQEQLRLVSQVDASMFVDRAFQQFIQVLNEYDDPDRRSARARGLALTENIPLTNEQCHELYQCGKTGSMRFGIIAGILERIDYSQGINDWLEEWISEIESLAPNKNNELDYAWIALSTKLGEAGYIAEALQIMESNLSAAWQGWLAGALLKQAHELDAQQAAPGRNTQLVVDVLAKRPEVAFVKALGRYHNSLLIYEESDMQPKKYSFTPLVHAQLLKLALAQIDTLDTNSCYEIANFALFFELDLFEVEKLFARVRTDYYTEDADAVIEKALQKLGDEEFHSQMARLKLGWFRNSCEYIAGAATVPNDFRAAMKYVQSAPDTSNRLKRFGVVWQHWGPKLKLRHPEGRGQSRGLGGGVF